MAFSMFSRSLAPFLLAVIMMAPTPCRRSHGRSSVAMAWLYPSSSYSKRSGRQTLPNLRRPIVLSSSSSPYDNNPSIQVLLRRASVEGVSVSPNGFWVILNVPESGYLPLQITNNPQDARAATSAEALTILQLVTGVDMAGAIFPPDVLSRMVIRQCDEDASDEEHEEDHSDNHNEPRIPLEIRAAIYERLAPSLPNGAATYSEAHPWFQSRIPLPQVSLDELQVAPEGEPMWTVSVKNVGSFSFCPSEEILASALYQYTAATSLAFCSLALCLRYKAPITVKAEQNHMFLSDLKKVQELFPMFASRSTLLQSSTRVQESIVRGFEIHKLTGALRIAMERGDSAAAQKIRQQLDQYDTMDQLPTIAGMSDNQYNNTYYQVDAMQ